MHGYDVLKKLRVAKVQAPVLILSGISEMDSKVRSFGFGADDYVCKPFHREELVARIHAVVRHSKGHSQSVIRTGNLAVNLDAKTVEVDSARVHLTGKEYAMLELLSLRKGTTITKDMFLNHLYSEMDEPELKIIDVFICKLRKKLAHACSGDTARMLENLRQRTDEMKTVAGLTNRGRASEALTVLGANVVSTKDRVGETTARWLALPLAERERTMILTSGRATRGDLNTAIQSGLIAEGTLKGEGRTIMVNETVDRTREDLRHSRLYEPGLRLELWGAEKSLGLKRDEYQITRLLAGGKVQLERDNKKITIDPKKLNPARREVRMTMIATKEIRLHEGDKIRWTGNDKDRGIHNSAIGRVMAIDGKSIVVENADKSVVRLNAGDAMLRRIDLAYTLNMHMAQGVTTDKAMIVMGSEERYLSNQRLFHVGVTRARDGITVITDDQSKLARQLDRTTGDKLSAAEVTGQVNIDRTASRAPSAKVDLGPIPNDALDLAPRNVSLSASGLASPARPVASEIVKGPASLPPLPVPEKSKGLEL